jgi:glycosyltransferase involved in cell wall biosynthesis
VKVLIDALSAREGGGVTYLRHILPALLAAEGGHEYHVLLSPRYQADLIAGLPAGAAAVPVEVEGGALLRRWRWQQMHVPRLVRRGGYDLLFTVVELGCLFPGCPHVVLCRNPNFYAALREVPGWRPRAKLALYRATRQPLVFLTLRRADRVAFVSDSFRRQVLGQLPLRADRARVVHHGLSPIFSRPAAGDEQAGAARPYLLTVSTLLPHKDYPTLVRGYARLAAGDPAVPDLRVAGAFEDPALARAAGEQARELGVEGRIHFLGRVAYDRLPALYRGAEALVLPSRLETFGHPLVEAMASGTPVVTTDLPICREICGDAALYFAPGDDEALAARVRTLLSDAALRDALRARGKARAADFSWEASARGLLAVFAEAAEGASRAG